MPAFSLDLIQPHIHLCVYRLAKMLSALSVDHCLNSICGNLALLYTQINRTFDFVGLPIKLHCM